MSRRERMDPETARVVEERLQWLLHENGPQSLAASTRRSAAPSASPSLEASPPLKASASLRTAPGPADPPPATSPQPLPRERRPRARPSTPEVREVPGAGALLAAVGSFRRPHLVIVAVIVGLGLLLSAWAVLRARPVAVAVTPPAATARAESVQPSAGGSGSPGAEPSGAQDQVVVHVLGAVKKPGLVTLPAGSRVQDALDAAGGLTRKADPGELNLAQQVADGQQILVGTKGKPTGEVRDGSGGSSGSSSSGSSSSGSSSSGGGSSGGTGTAVNLNSATQAQLEELPGVGPVMAGKIIAWRTEHGRFSRVEELQEIGGVGPKTYAKLAPLCRV